MRRSSSGSCRRSAPGTGATRTERPPRSSPGWSRRAIGRRARVARSASPATPSARHRPPRPRRAERATATATALSRPAPSGSPATVATVQLEITHFTDPACPFAFSAEPVRFRLRWHYGDGLAWRTRMIVLTLEPGEAEKLAEGAPGLQRRYGMPIDPAPYARPASSEPACRAVVAAQLHAPGRAEALLRRLRIRVMNGGLLDDPDLLAGAARDAGLGPVRVTAWSDTDAVAAALAEDVAAARRPPRA